MSDSAESVIRGTFFIPWMSDSGETDNCGAVLPVWLSVSGESDNQGMGLRSGCPILQNRTAKARREGGTG
jgi:hypothetical protein